MPFIGAAVTAATFHPRMIKMADAVELKAYSIHLAWIKRTYPDLLIQPLVKLPV
jgi:hypothetical protein